MLNRTPMKSMLVLAFIFFGITVVYAEKWVKSGPPIANAGPDQMIYLTKTSTVNLNGSASSGDSYEWTDISTDQINPAIISSPSSDATTVTGLIQGTWYYQLAVTRGGITVRDTVIIRVDYDVPPKNSTLLRELPIARMSAIANIRDDTTKYWGTTDPCPPCIRTLFTDSVGKYVILQRPRENGQHVDSAKGKYYTTIEDGWAAETGKYGLYSRSELLFGSYYTMDSNITYCYEFKGYYPQSVKNNMKTIMDGNQYGTILSMMQWHNAGGDPFSPPFQLQLMRDSVVFDEDGSGGNGATVKVKLLPTDDAIIMRTHTYRVTIREGMGYPGQKAFIKVEVDGIQKYFRNKGTVGGTIGRDYPKFSGLYDWAHAIVNPDSLARGKKFSLVTESYKIYQLDDY